MTWKLTNNKDWTTLKEQFSWVADMEQVPQHKIHHAEGNVAIHTQMVLEQLTNNPAYQKLDAQTQEILWVAALLHDIEKRSTSIDEGDGIISANGHARKGEFTTRSILFRDIPTPFHIREQIASLVRLHGLPIWLMEKNEPEKKVNEASLRVNTQHLEILTEADLRGRICEDMPTLLDALSLFEMLCKEQDCWKKPRYFETSHARFHYFNTSDGYVDYIPFDNFKCKVTMLSGLPGMGKDHYIKQLGEDFPIVSMDAIRRKHKISPSDSAANGWVVQTAKEEARVFLRKGQDFAWNATNITRNMRSQLISLFTGYGAKVKIVYIEKPYAVWRKQNKEREHMVPENIMDRMLSKLEIPQLTEAHEIEYSV